MATNCYLAGRKENILLKFVACFLVEAVVVVFVAAAGHIVFVCCVVVFVMLITVCAGCPSQRFFENLIKYLNASKLTTATTTQTDVVSYQIADAY